MKHKRGVKELLGQNGTSGGVRAPDKLCLQASLSMGVTPPWKVGENRLEEKKRGECVITLSKGFMHLLSVGFHYSAEADWDTDWR